MGKKLQIANSSDPIEVNVVGVTFEGRQSVVAQLSVNEQVWLCREPHNLHDHNAIRVERQNGQQIGYISRHLAADLADRFDNYGKPVPAVVTALTGGYSPGSAIGVRIRFAVPEFTTEPTLPKLPPARPGQPVTLALTPAVELELLPVPAGPFLMGSDPDRDEDAREEELPQHVVHLDAYMIGRYPVTNAQYAVFVQSAGHPAPEDWKLGRLPSGKENHPVVKVSWDDAAAFCAWLTELLRAARRGSGESLVARLPTEAEWEKAARGTDGRIYPWGDEKPTSKLCNFGKHVKATTAVGRYSPAGDSPYGCADMAGNVSEWTRSLWGASLFPHFGYPYDPEDGRENLEAGDDVRRVLRGGSFSSTDNVVRCASRGLRRPDLRYTSGGFRLVASPPHLICVNLSVSSQ